MGFRIFGIEVERKTDILAFAAFVISLGSMLTQGLNLIKGPRVELEQPMQVLFNLHQYPDGRRYLRISAKMIYINSGSPGYDDIIKTESAIVILGKNSIELIGHKYVQIDSIENSLIINVKSDADPVQIPSGSVVSHETYYAPWPSSQGGLDKNFVDEERFLSMLAKNQKVQVNFKVTTYSGKVLEKRCMLQTNHFVQHVQQKKWSAPACEKK